MRSLYVSVAGADTIGGCCVEQVLSETISWFWRSMILQRSATSSLLGAGAAGGWAGAAGANAWAAIPCA
eukprot:4834483-Prymnesium_polylepis.1